MCFVEAEVQNERLWWRWTIQSGGGWSWRGGEEIVTHATGLEYRPDNAKRAIDEWLDQSHGED